MVGAIGGIGAVGGFGGAGLSAVSGVANAGHLGAMQSGTVTAAAGAVNAPAQPGSTVSISAAGRNAFDSDSLRSSVATLATNSGVQGVNNGAQGAVSGSAAQSVNGNAVSNSTVNSSITIDIVNAPSETINLANQNLSGFLQPSTSVSGTTGVNNANIGSIIFDLFAPINTFITNSPGIQPNDQAVALLLLALLMRQTDQTNII